MIKFFIDGGPFMYVIALLSILAFAMVLEKYFALTFSYPFRRNFFGKVVKSVRERNISGAAKMCRSTGHPLAAVISEILPNGISTAMNTTAFGLIVAIPCIVAYAMLANKESSILQKYDETINEILHIIEHEHADRSSSRSKAA